MKSNKLLAWGFIILILFSDASANQLTEDSISVEKLLLLDESIDELLSSSRKCKKELTSVFTIGYQCKLFFSTGNRYREIAQELKELEADYQAQFDGFKYSQDVSYHRIFSDINIKFKTLQNVLVQINQQMDTISKYNWQGWDYRYSH
jgi:hypothetical protein